MTKAAKIREMSDDHLVYALNDAKQALFKLRFEASPDKLDTAGNIRATRREIARLITIQKERETSKLLAEAAKAAPAGAGAPGAAVAPAAGKTAVAAVAAAGKSASSKPAAGKAEPAKKMG